MPNNEKEMILQLHNRMAWVLQGVSGYFDSTIFDLQMTGKIGVSAFFERTFLFSARISCLNLPMGHTETIPNWKELIDHYSALTVFPTSPGGIHNYKIFEDLWEKGDYPAIYFSGLKPENFAFSTWVINLNIDTPFYKSRLSSKYQFKTLKELVLAELENPNMDIFMGGMRNEVYREIDNAMKKSKFKKANKLILSAIEKDPLNPIYWWNLAQTYIRMEKLKEAKLATRFGIGLDPYFHPFWKAFL